MTYSTRQIPVLLALLAAFVMAPVAPEAGNMLFLCAGGIGLLTMGRAALRVVRRPIVMLPLIGLAILAIAYMLGDGSINGLIGIVYFAPLLAIWPLATLAEDAPISTLPWLVAIMALAGAAAACSLAISEVLATGTTRAGELVANPIHFADVVLLVGFLSTLGLFLVPTRWRFVFVLGPLLAVVAVVLSGTRGAVVAAAGMIAVAFVMAAVVKLISWKQLLVLVGAAVVVLAVGLIAGLGSMSGIQRVMADMRDVAASGLPQDASTAERLMMYTGGFRAFLASPIFGHGPLHFVAAAMMEMNSTNTPPHLHNDLADFAASAGIMGLIAYGLFIAAPVLEMRRGTRSMQSKGIIIVGTTLIAGYVMMGLTNAMFGILTLTCSYAAIAVVIAAMCSDKTDPQTT